MHAPRFRTHVLPLFCALCAISAINATALAESPMNQTAESPEGAWRGQSVCVVRPSACHDEEALYRISRVAANRLNLSGNKIVDGKEVNMGSGECDYDAKAGTVDCPLPGENSLHLEIKGRSMQGLMTLHDGTVWRKISLRKMD